MSSRGARLTDPRLPRFVSLLILFYFVAEWVVAATWRGLYSYRADGFGLLGLPFCGPGGDWPCSALSPVFNLALVVTGVAIAVIAASWQLGRLITTANAVLLAAAGVGLVTSGLITQRIDYGWHVTAVNVFLALGAIGVFLVGADRSIGFATTARWFALAAGVVGFIGFFGYLGGFTGLLGPGGTQRLAVYAILAAVFVLAMSNRAPAATGRGALGTHDRDEVQV